MIFESKQTMKLFYVTENGKLHTAPANCETYEDVWDHIGFHNIQGVVIVINETEATNWKAILGNELVGAYTFGMDQYGTYDKIITPTGMLLKAVECDDCKGCALDEFSEEVGMYCSQAPLCSSQRSDRKSVIWARVEK